MGVIPELAGVTAIHSIVLTQMLHTFSLILIQLMMDDIQV